METATFRNPRLVALILLVVISAGLSALLSLGRQEDPTITNINAVVTTLYPGADPARVEALVTQKLEDELREIAEIDTLTSTSSTGVSVIQIELAETVDPAIIESVWTDVRDAMDDASRSFPDGAGEPVFDDTYGAFAAIAALVPARGGVTPAIQGRYAEELADLMRAVPGTKNVEVFGEPEEEVLVQLDPEETAALGLTAADVSAAIRAADAKVRSGRLQSDGSDLLLEVGGEIRALDRLRQVVVAEDGAGHVTRLGEIAAVTRGPKTPGTDYALSDGKPAILVAARLEDGLQVDVWMHRLKEDLAAFDAALPQSLRAELIFDQSRYTAERLAEVAKNMGMGVALVVLVLLVTLGFRAALIVGLVLPVVSLATLASMNMIGLPLHQMSVTGLIVALGLLVDAAIVMTDEVRQRLAHGMGRERAVGDAVRRLAMPLLASTVTTALSFAPMILLPGPAGDFVGAIAISVVFMLGWSLVIALTVTPAIAGWVLPEGESGHGISGGWLGRRFHGTILWSVKNPVRSVMLALILPVTGFVSLGGLTAQFFPGTDRDQFHVEVELPKGTAIPRTRATVDRMDAMLRAETGITHVAWTIGESAPAFYYNVIGFRENAPGFAQALVTTESPAATARLLVPLQDKLNRAFPEARILVRGLVQGPPVAAPVELRLTGPDIATLRELGEEVRATLLGLDAVTIVRSSLEGGAPKAAIDIDEAAANLAGLTLGDVAAQLQAGLEGVTGGSLIEGSEELPVRVRLGDGIRGDLDRIANLPILPPAARETAAGGAFPGLPLSAVAEIRLEPAKPEITRRNGERSNTIQAFVQPQALPEEVLAEALSRLDLALPPGYRLEVGGDSDARNDVVTNLMAPLGLIVTLSIATVVLTFSSFRLTAVTFVVAILSAGLSFLSLAVFNYPFGITAIIGVIGSIGVSINAALIIMSGLQAHPVARTGDPEAMAEVVMDSSRHIISTTVTTFGGFLPLILGGGGFWPPFAMSIAGGVLLSTVVSFYFTPQMFALVYPPRGRRESRRELRGMPGGLKLAAE
ncbi:efflux RND transporter permease subunit [Mangrovicoccus sp. HB161399]|uniref:efflux RND transporter permease subunit n=1 Tax=Mangrovicoccus sp. HB161399 TaxID=2720392 RepID=UPI001556AE95|nr:efflux RND transporter permease subunit [Mangrovicoccus sp. HB161399]